MLAGMVAAAAAPPGDFQAARPAYWFPLLLFGGVAALSLPLSVIGSPRPPSGIAVLSAQVYPTVTEAMYFGGGSSTRPFPFPLGWYWVGALVAGLLLTGAWHRRRDRRTGRRALGIITAVYIAAVGLAGFLELQQAFILPTFPLAGRAVLLPAAVLLLSGLGALASGLRDRPR